MNLEAATDKTSKLSSMAPRSSCDKLPDIRDAADIAL